MNAGQRWLSIAKGRHRYVFCYCDGQESDILACLVALADDRSCDFDWFDAAVLSYQMGKQRDSELDPVA
ncbi:MAG: hypothetical protein KKB50_08495 [Planctomycetes bacterium]|nr:hypothetical protein [Planctomycetota bacterium]